MIRCAAASAILTGVLLLPSCVLPIPNRTVHREGISGKVVDAETKQPIANASVKVTYGSPLGDRTLGQTIEVPTSSRGRYKIPWAGRWNWGYFYGPISGPMSGLTPNLGMSIWLSKVAKLEISAPGYRPLGWSRDVSKEPLPPRQIHLRLAAGSR